MVLLLGPAVVAVDVAGSPVGSFEPAMGAIVALPEVSIALAALAMFPRTF